jgi:CcmD family protein
MAFIFGAFFALWAITFGYLFMLGSRQRHLERELAQYREIHDAASRNEAAPEDGAGRAS